LSLLELWELKIQRGNGRPFKADLDMYHLALDIVVSAAFDFPRSKSTIVKQTAHLKALPQERVTSAKHPSTSISFEVLPLEPELQACVYLTESIGVSFQSVFPRFAHWLYLRKPQSRKATRLKEHFIERNINQAIERLGNKEENTAHKMRCAVDQLLLREKSLAEKERRKPDFHKRAIYDELFGYIVVGHDTTSVTLSWWVKFMSRHQSSQSCLRKAIHQAFSAALSEKRLPNINEITHSQIPYLDAVIEETHRCAHIVPTVIRQSTTDTELLGYRIPKGTHVFFYTSGASFMQPAFPIPDEKRSPSGRKASARFGVWDAATVGEFMPERWLKTEEKGTNGEQSVAFDAQAGPQMAFGTGSRGCFGRRLAYLEMRVAIVLLIWKFEFLELEDELGSFEGVDFFAVTPRMCYVKLRKIVDSDLGDVRL
jgi:cytochrome P450